MKINVKQPKKKVNRKKLVAIFTMTFVAFFVLLTTIASMITPKIDIPALNDEDNITSITSEDFKGRIDPRLKALELREDGTLPDESQQTTETAQDTTTNSSSQSAEILSDNNAEVNDNTDQESEESLNNDDQLMPAKVTEKNYNEQKLEPKNKNIPVKSNSITPQEPTKRQEVEMNDIPRPALRNKVQIERQPLSMVKVIVGQYSNPAEASKASQAINNSGLNVTPFIRERNGVYSVQVGTFSSQQRAETLVRELKQRNFSAVSTQD